MFSERDHVINSRPEIDGLRAISVLSIILYHSSFSIFGIKLFEGGFVGVDIFFVISGYLITSIILKEIYITNSFSFKNFYENSKFIIDDIFKIIKTIY
jgi:peptidoglycan/LPS O-acetylase OafA/YrhL